MSFRANAVNFVGEQNLSTSEFELFVDYYCIKGYYSHLQQLCTTFTKNAGRTMSIQSLNKARFWLGLSLSFQGQTTEAIRELTAIKDQPGIQLATTAALVSCHKQSEHKDRESLKALKSSFSQLQRTKSEDELVFAGHYFWHAAKVKNSRQCLDNVLKRSKRNPEALTVYGFLNLYSGVERQERKAINFFEAALEMSQGKMLTAILGRAYAKERSGQVDAALNDMNSLIVAFSGFTPAIAEKARFLMMQDHWDEAVETCERALEQDPHELDALSILVTHLLTRVSASDTAYHKAKLLQQAIEVSEPSNSALYSRMSTLVSRLCQRNKQLLDVAMDLIEKAISISGKLHNHEHDSQYITEKAHQLVLQYKYEQAAQLFQDAARIDDGNAAALHGRIYCQILLGNVTQAAQEFEFLVAEDSASNAPLVIFLQALLAWHVDKDEHRSVEFLNQATQCHLDILGQHSPGVDLYLALEPDFLVSIAREYTNHIGTEPRDPADPSNPMLKRVVDLLTQLCDYVPGMNVPRILLALCYYLDRQWDEAERELQRSLEVDAGQPSAHILRAQICIAKGSILQAQEALEKAHSLDFEVRSRPVYQLTYARLLQAQGKVEGSLQLLMNAMNIPGVRRASAAHPVPLQDRINLFLELASVHTQLGHVPEAAKVMQDAHHEFQNTSEKHRINIFDAALSVKRGDVEAGLKALNQIPPDSVYFVRAKLQVADIYLKHKKNKRMYCACFQQLARQNPTVHQYILLGEAYLRVQEPEQAIAAYEKALEVDPTNSSLASRIGRALVSTHDFSRAVQYYVTATRNDASQLHLFHELADLYLQLEQYDKAILVLMRSLGESDGGSTDNRPKRDMNDLGARRLEVTSYLKMANVFRAIPNVDNAEQPLQDAFGLQTAILAKAKSIGDTQLVQDEQSTAASICCRLAEYYTSKQQSSKALQYYNEALKFDRTHAAAMLSMAKIHLASGDLEACQQQCQGILHLDPNNQDATMLVADVMFRKNDHDNALKYFQKLLRANPADYKALSNLIILVRRAGRLDVVSPILQHAENSSPSAAHDPGLHFCKGLYAQSTYDSQTALAEFNKCRKDGEWGKRALHHMISIYINPDGAKLFHEAVEASGDKSQNLKAANELLHEAKEVGDMDGETQDVFRTLEGYILLSRGSRSAQEQASEIFRQQTQLNKNNVSALLGLANAFYLQKQMQPARNQLKRITKVSEIDPKYIDDVQNAMLLLAVVYINSGKYDIATDLCNKARKLDRSNAKAFELLGTICEKTLAYKDAADHYERAWELINRSSEKVGYELAFNYLKAKKYLEAIEVCHAVFRMNPEYPRLKEDVLDKAREGLRP